LSLINYRPTHNLFPQNYGFVRVIAQQVIDLLEHSISDMMSQLVDRSSSPSGRRARRHVSSACV